MVDANSFLPGWQFIIFIFLFVIFFIGGIAFIIYFYAKRAWPYKVLVLENQTGHGAQPKLRTKAKLVTVGDGGEEIFLLKKPKKYRVGYGKYIGPNYICWTIGSDGFWYNTIFGDIDSALRKVGLVPVDRDARLATASSRKLVKDNYSSKSFMEKYGPAVYFGMFFMTLLIFGGIMWFAFDKQAEIAAINNEVLATSLKTAELNQRVLSNLENICSGGSGFVANAT